MCVPLSSPSAQPLHYRMSLHYRFGNGFSCAFFLFWFPFFALAWLPFDIFSYCCCCCWFLFRSITKFVLMFYGWHNSKLKYTQIDTAVQAVQRTYFSGAVLCGALAVQCCYVTNSFKLNVLRQPTSQCTLASDYHTWSIDKVTLNGNTKANNSVEIEESAFSEKFDRILQTKKSFEKMKMQLKKGCQLHQDNFFSSRKKSVIISFPIFLFPFDFSQFPLDFSFQFRRCIKKCGN